MAEEFNIIIEHLRSLRESQDNMRRDMQMMQEDMNGIKMHVAALVGAEARQDGDMANLRQRIERIETRLGLVEDPH